MSHTFSPSEKHRGAEVSLQKRRASKRDRQADLKKTYLGGLTNVKVLALKYDVSEKTIYRDLEEIIKGLEK